MPQADKMVFVTVGTTSFDRQARMGVTHHTHNRLLHLLALLPATGTSLNVTVLTHLTFPAAYVEAVH